MTTSICKKIWEQHLDNYNIRYFHIGVTKRNTSVRKISKIMDYYNNKNYYIFKNFKTCLVLEKQ